MLWAVVLNRIQAEGIGTDILVDAHEMHASMVENGQDGIAGHSASQIDANDDAVHEATPKFIDLVEAVLEDLVQLALDQKRMS